MLHQYVLSLAIASAGFASSLQAAGFADAVLNYIPGTGIPAGYDLPTAALGEPSRITSGEFGGPVDPFSPPFLADQVVSIGAGGSLTLGFDAPVPNDPSNPFGLDFIVFGNSGFQIVNGDFTGGGITDGTLLGANGGVTRVSVSSDGQNFYELTPSLAPVVDGPFPTDGTGDFSRPLDPALSTSAFNGKNLQGIRELYNGSAGGAAYDISWARNSSGDAITLDTIHYLRIDVISGVSEIDGVAVVPEPSVLALLAVAGGIFAWKRRR